MALQDQHEPSGKVDYLVLLLAALMVAVLFLWIAHIRQGVLPQNCHMAGFRTCAGDMPVITPPHRRDKLE